jgi:hypothetical protein
MLFEIIISALAIGGAVMAACYLGALKVPNDFQEQDKKFRHLH